MSPKLPSPARAETIAFRNDAILMAIADNTAALLRLIDESRYDITLLDAHELQTMLGVCDLRDACQRFVLLAREIRTLRTER